MATKTKNSIFTKSIALATLWIFLCSNVSFALRPRPIEEAGRDKPVAMADRPSSGSSKPVLTREEDRLLAKLENIMREKGMRVEDIEAVRPAYLALRSKLVKVKILGFTAEELLRAVLRTARQRLTDRGVDPASLFRNLEAQNFSRIRMPQDLQESLTRASATLEVIRRKGPPIAAAPRPIASPIQPDAPLNAI